MKDLSEQQILTQAMAHLAGLALLMLALPALAELPTSCPAQEIEKSRVDALIQRRASTFNHCLVCAGQTCQMKNWPPAGADFARQCKILFCTPTRIPRSTILPEEADQDGSFRFTYAIGKNGRVKDINITEISGSLTEKTALKIAKSSYKRRKYVPVIINGEAYELANLTDVMRLRVRLDMNVNR